MFIVLKIIINLWSNINYINISITLSTNMLIVKYLEVNVM